METLTSRKNPKIQLLRRLGTDAAERKTAGLYLCEGVKTLREALQFQAHVTAIYWKEEPIADPAWEGIEQILLPADLFDYVSPLKNCPGPLFTVAIRGCEKPGKLQNAIVLENVQDPGNVGTVIRSANAFGISAVILTGDCADLYQPKTVRATMGAIFRQPVLTVPRDLLGEFLRDQGLPLYGAALDPMAQDLRETQLRRAAVAVGSEGQGLSRELLALCEKKIIIPMRPDSESLNAAVAASVLMWEMAR